MSDVNGTKKLIRTRDGRIVAGVCSGIGEYLGVDANVIRLVFALITVFTAGFGILLYLAAWVVVPEEGEKSSIAEKMIKKEYVTDDLRLAYQAGAGRARRWRWRAWPRPAGRAQHRQPAEQRRSGFRPGRPGEDDDPGERPGGHRRHQQAHRQRAAAQRVRVRHREALGHHVAARQPAEQQQASVP